MAYEAVSFSAGEVVTTAKMNKLGTNDATFNTQFNNYPRAIKEQRITSNSTVANQYMQRGWTYVTWTGSTTTSSITITLPDAFDDTNYDIVAMCIGYKNGSNPADRTDITGLQDCAIEGKILTSQTFTLEAKKIDGVNVNSAFRTLISWIAIGKKE